VRLHSSIIRKTWWKFLTIVTVVFIKLFGKKEVLKEKINLNEIKKILVIRIDRVGDLILATPVFENIKMNLPNVKVDVLVREYNKNVLSGNPYVDNVLVYSLKTLLNLKQQKYDLSINLIYEFELKSAIACYLSNAKFRLGYSDKYTSAFFNLELKKEKGPKYELYRNLDLLRYIGIETSIDKAKLYPSEEDFKKIKDYFIKNNISSSDILIGFNPGTGRKIRRWQPEKFILLGKELIKKYNAKIVIIWGKSERIIAQRIVDSVGKNCIMALPTNILELTALIKNFKVFVSGNTGPIHIAMAVGTPTVGLYGKNDYQNWTPPYNEKLVIIKGEKCKDIEVDDVLKGVEKFLK